MTNKSSAGISRICPQCSTPDTSGKSFCINCGTALVEARNCEACGAILKKTALFCPGCGASATQKVQVSTNPTPAKHPAGLSLGKWMILGVAAIVILAAIAFFVILPLMATPMDKGLSANPEVQVLNHRAWAMNGKMKYQDALTVADKATLLDAASADAWANKGWALAGLGKYSDAIIALDKATSLDPDNAITWSNKGFAQLNLGRCTEAVSCFDKALALDPYDYAAINYRKVAGRC
jgi:tetratricopeptide (TPR) repeat protein